MRKLTTAHICCLMLIGLLTAVSHACTSFCMETPTGPVFGFNLDLFIPADGLIFINQRDVSKEGFQPGTTGEKLKWVSKYGSVTFNLAGREFAVGGMNETGLVVGAMQLLKSEFPEMDERPGLTIGLWAQYVLDTCGTIEEVIQVDKIARIEDTSPPVHYLIANAEGNCATIEWFDGKCEIRSGDKVPVKAMSNMSYERALAAFERGGARWWWSNPGQSAERFAAAHNRSISYDASKDPDAITYAFGTLLNVAAPHTKWSIVYDMGKKEIWYGTVVSQPVKHLSFKNLDFTCKDPVLMLDVNAQIEGDVEKSFIPYDHTTNLNLFRTLCQRYNLNVSDEDTLAIVGQFENFKCAESEK